jgi:hypothetical protein
MPNRLSCSARSLFAALGALAALLGPACGARSQLAGEEGDGGAQTVSGGAAGDGGGGTGGSPASTSISTSTGLPPGTKGPVHTFAGLSSSFYVTQFNCTNSGGNPEGDADYFCTHFYSPACSVLSWTEATSTSNPQMHSGINCNDPDPNGFDVPATSCVGGPCKIGNYDLALGGLTDIVCQCP